MLLTHSKCLVWVWGEGAGLRLKNRICSPRASSRDDGSCLFNRLACRAEGKGPSEWYVSTGAVSETLTKPLLRRKLVGGVSGPITHSLCFLKRWHWREEEDEDRREGEEGTAVTAVRPGDTRRPQLQQGRPVAREPQQCERKAWWAVTGNRGMHCAAFLQVEIRFKPSANCRRFQRKPHIRVLAATKTCFTHTV